MKKISDYCNVEKGKTGIQKAISGPYPLVVTAEERLNCNEYQFDCDAVCIPMVSSTGHGHASINRIHFQSGKFALGNILCAVFSKDENILLTKYLFIYLAFYKDAILVPLMKGSANVALSLDKIKNIKISIPEISKQREIVKKYNEFEKQYDIISERLVKLQSKMSLFKDSLVSTFVSNLQRSKINDLFFVEKGSLQSSKAIAGKYDFITASEEWKTHKEYDHDCEAIIFAMGASGSLGRTHYVNGKFISSDLCFILTKKNNSIDLKFYVHLFESMREKIVRDLSTGSAKKAINRNNFINYELPIINKDASKKINEQLEEVNNQLELLNSIEQKCKKMFNSRISEILSEVRGAED